MEKDTACAGEDVGTSSQSLIGREWQENGISFARLCETKDITVLLWSKMPEKHGKWTLDSC